MEVRLFSRRSGKCVSIIDYSRDDGANAVQSVCGANFANEIFKLEPASEEGFYYLKAAHSGKCLEVADASTADHANVQQSACADADNQKFQFTKDENGIYDIVAKHSDKCLDLSGGSSDNGANIQQWSCEEGNDNQRWSLLGVQDKIVTVTSRRSGKLLEIANDSDSNGANIQVWTDDGNINKWFVMARMEDENGVEYFRIIAQNSGKCLDVTGGSQDNGANVQLNDCEDVEQQKFTLEVGADSYHRIVAKHSGKCLDLAGGGTGDGVNIQQYTCVGADDISADNQLWLIKKM